MPSHVPLWLAILAALAMGLVVGLINGSEPVTVASMRKFNEAFAPYGLPKTAIKPCYGMAEATLFVSATQRENEAKVVYVDRDDLNAGTFTLVDSDSVESNPRQLAGRTAQVHLKAEHAYYYASVLALTPVLLLGVKSVGHLGIYEAALIVIFEIVACFYVARRK